ncbi:preprotein translocase subunit SecE [Candidatus Giovannonibacteria bacterium RIFCSPHIGHO2_02_43_13]|uniref:Protein translocase subunit SecE n=1 Tax=Candidatus Giovannonibacteria bacterium RIFCSPHIGHO2_02_43_13 TaxID=1798330 RepID=A0A1F5WUY6_9BACT|nr:MAG: preprotein translocase subunit SecE [Candidatus Giovannonibacteria bacterium RIFCSPHIGHO2_12_FULL_44_42]OGF79460.1 MAG: preprotein translocase subunit SecE [Candidatus Giovannonibacteria bacterium RIFCSPHIGHO2_02_43_13]OGF89706.1 MAG: preprotein translocase subunit SecE [Candidatus Giovannonibacteria bacterium RIFCSPLOWO2_02_FULL_43_54]OGF96589.1 MAG: preprotein translocase subunit SecE [Candidatus Giovannonibacteria bacterium RIFCSPLOWO2_12_FULL_44_32]
MWNNIVNYFKDTRVEMKKVNWPTRQQTIRYTIVVIAVSLGVAAILGAFDYIFASVLQLII